MHASAYGPLPATRDLSGTAARQLLQGHDDLYDLAVRYRDGHVEHSNLSRYLPDRDAHMARVCAWLVRTGRDRAIEAIELIAYARLGMRYVYRYDPRRPERYELGVRGEQ